MRFLSTLYVLVLLCLRIPAARAADCMAASRSVDVADRLKAAETALHAADPDAFQTAMEEITLLVPCLADSLSPSAAAELHRLVGVQQYSSGNAASATPAFLAARVLEPTYRFPEAEFSADHAIRKAYDSLNAGDYKDQRVPEPKSGDISFDGTVTRARPADRDTVVQFLNASKQVTQTMYLRPGQPLPTYTAVPHIRNSLLLGTAVAIVGSAACYGGAWVSHGQFEKKDPSYGLAELKSLQGAANILFGASIGFGALAVGGGTGALLVGAR
jgi:hypothetical protein